jgi:hypothetical protein
VLPRRAAEPILRIGEHQVHCCEGGRDPLNVSGSALVVAGAVT